MRLRICFKVNGLATDEDGNPAPTGACLDLGEVSEPIPYEVLTEPFCFKENVESLLKMVFLDRCVTPEDIEIITPEEYDRDFGDTTD